MLANMHGWRICLWLALLSLASTVMPSMQRLNKRSFPQVITATQGTFTGNRLAGGLVDEYLAVPFAQPPVGNLRFQKTQGIQPFLGRAIRDATKPGAICMQPDSLNSPTSQVQSEDCLHLTIYKPANVPKDVRLPVMVWIYGGSWQEGNNAQARTNATDLILRSIDLGEPVVWVAPNYRVGAWGFLGGQAIIDAQANGKATLNAGLWDQHEALQWINANIAAFGGDPNRVTLFGQSAGAASVGNQLMADKGRANAGLVHAAIFQSGNAATGRRLPANSAEVQQTFEYVLQGSGCGNATGSDEQMSCLKSRTVSQLAAGNHAAIGNSYVAFQPQLDGYFIQQVPSAQWAAGEYLKVPFITGTNLDEGTEFPYPLTVTDDEGFKAGQLFCAGKDIHPILNDILETWSADPSEGEPYRPDYFGISKADTYFPPNGTNQYKRQAAMDQDVFFETGKAMQLQAAISTGIPAWSYRFAQPSALSINAHDVAKASMGVQHEAEIPYVYMHPDTVQGTTFEGRIPEPLATYASDANMLAVSRMMSAAWIHFANHHDPNGQDVEQIWRPFSGNANPAINNGQTLYIQANNITMTTDTSSAKQVAFVIANKQYFHI